MKAKLTRRGFLHRSGAAALGLALGAGWRIEAAPRFDLLLKGGLLLDGTGGPAWPADLGLLGDSIAAIDAIPAEQARRVLDVSGLHVAPGFIDIHSHSDGDILAYPRAESRVLQGVTTEVTGNCGSSAAPLGGIGDEERRRRWREEEGVEAEWTDVDSYFAQLERTGISINQALLLGQGSLRASAIGLVDRALTPDELAQVVRAVEEGMSQGAFGLSTGLEYTPGAYTPTEEIVALAQVVARRDGLYASHIRNEERALLTAVDEAIQIGRRTGARVEVSHLKAAGRPNWPKQRAALDLIESARARGVDVLADAYPYTAYSTTLTIFLPQWSREGGEAALLERMREPETRERIRGEVAAQVGNDPGDFDLIVISRLRGPENLEFVGHNIVEIAEAWGIEPVEALLQLLEEEEGRVAFIGHGMSPGNVETVLAHPLVMIGSDGSAMAPVGKAAQARPHPRSYGAFARVLGYYVREHGLLDLPTAIKKMTSMPADQLGLPDRGRIARGMKADLVVFNAAQVSDRATFADPQQYPTGIAYVLVNGALVVEQGQHTGARPGRALRKV